MEETYRLMALFIAKGMKISELANLLWKLNHNIPFHKTYDGRSW